MASLHLLSVRRTTPSIRNQSVDEPPAACDHTLALRQWQNLYQLLQQASVFRAWRRQFAGSRIHRQCRG
jgi:hypothetical protein